MDTVAEGSETKEKRTFAGIPEAVFVDDVEKFMSDSENGSNAELVLRRLDEQHSKYKFMEVQLASKKRRLKGQIPDLEKSLEMLRLLRSKKDEGETMESQFLLSDQVHIKASVPPTEKVCLWLGANVMLEYSLEDADALLQKNINTAKTSLSQVDNDLDFLKDQSTTTEVNMARVYNWDVKRKRTVKTNSV